MKGGRGREREGERERRKTTQIYRKFINTAGTGDVGDLRGSSASLFVRSLVRDGEGGGGKGGMVLRLTRKH